MDETNAKIPTPLRYIAIGLGGTLVLFFYSNWLLYSYLMGWLTIVPGRFLYAITLLSLPVLLGVPSVRARVLANPAVPWLLWFGILTLIWFLAFPQSKESESVLSNHMNLILVFGVTASVLAVPQAKRILRQALAVAVVVGGALNLWELISPMTLASVPGRSSGLYMNANQSALALVLGALVSFDCLSARMRGIFLALLIPAVLVTFSRSGILLMVIMILGFLWAGELKPRQIGFAILGGVLALVVMIGFISQSGWESQSRFLSMDLLDRVNLSTNDYSSLDRAAVARAGWAYVLNAPWFGHGLASTRTWALEASTHIMYLDLMSDHGAWGVLIYPALVFSVAPRNRLGLIAVVVLLLMGFFTHNILDEWPLIICLAVLSCHGAAGPPTTSKAGAS